MINFIGTFNVVPSLPSNLEPLREIVNNLYWSWNQDALELFRRLDAELWKSTNHNPVALLGRISQTRLEEVSNDDGFLSHMNRVYVQLNVYLEETTWYQKNAPDAQEAQIAYFSAEYGLSECLQIYSGGLGVLSGDHLKSASDLGIPLVAVGLCYKEGYFQQYLTTDGWQQEKYDINDFYNQPMSLVTDEEGEPVKIELDFPGRKVSFQIWKIQVGRIELFLLDTNVPENTSEDRKITRGLYGGNIETRIQQEIVLGIGGIHALHKMGIQPQVCHMNEGHSAFLSLQRINYLMKRGLSFSEAKEINFFSNVFTTHTPVPAGIDVFPNELVEKYFGDFYRKKLGLSDKQFYRLGTIDKEKEPKNFNMAHLAMNMASYVNGVSRLHSKVSKTLWVEGYKDIPFDEIPIDYVTNGVHTRSHLSNDMYELFYRYLGSNFDRDITDPEIWEKIDEIPDEELWRTHERRKERLVAFARSRLKKQIIARGGSSSEIRFAKEVLDASALTIGFARRFATYKRANLIFRDIERLAQLICDSERPLQFIIAGKAHPMDEEGKKLIQEIFQAARLEHFRKRIVFIENYDMNVARYMVEGCDIWLNNPRRPFEASGTSGMKVIANGGLNLSVLDGWWDEAYNRKVGWRIGNGEDYKDPDYQDEVESRLIYETLEKEIIPLYYDRGEEKLPRHWIDMMKDSMKKLGPQFNSNRMVQEYTEKFYLPSYKKRLKITEDEWKTGKEFTIWREKVVSGWDKVRFTGVSGGSSNEAVKVGDKYLVEARVELGALTPNDVELQIYFGNMDEQEVQNSNEFVKMEFVDEGNKSKQHKFKGEIDCSKTGQFGYTLRILPKHELLVNQFELGLIRWV